MVIFEAVKASESGLPLLVSMKCGEWFYIPVDVVNIEPGRIVKATIKYDWAY